MKKELLLAICIFSSSINVAEWSYKKSILRKKIQPSKKKKLLILREKFRKQFKSKNFGDCLETVNAMEDILTDESPEVYFLRAVANNGMADHNETISNPLMAIKIGAELKYPKSFFGNVYVLLASALIGIGQFQSGIFYLKKAAFLNNAVAKEALGISFGR